METGTHPAVTPTVAQVVMGPVPCHECAELVVYARVRNGEDRKSGKYLRWRDPVTYRVHQCPAVNTEGEQTP